jgi:inner membrane protein
MDNICHTLVGAALGEAGLRRRSPLAVPALLLGANLPDVDVFAYFDSPIAALGFRRGWTHGPVGLVVLSLVLAGLLTAMDRLRAKGTGGERVRVGPLLLVIFAAAVTHPVLDFLNNYGVRWLMPFDRSWHYGDTLFIVDPWVWGVLALGVIWSRRQERHGQPRPHRPAAMALAAVVLYVACMGWISSLTRGAVQRELVAGGVNFERVMVAPVALNMIARDVLVETNHRYRFGKFSWAANPRLEFASREIPENETEPMSLAAAATPEGRTFLSWSRFPYFLVDESRGVVRIMDARYNADWASVTIPTGLVKEPDAH